MTTVETEHEVAGWAHLKSHKNHEAIKDFTEDLSTNLNARSFIGRSQAYFNLKEYAKATVDAKVALDMDRSNVKAWYAFANALFGAGKYDGCLAACHNGLEYASDDPKLLQVQESCRRRIRGEPDEPVKKWSDGHDHAHGHAHDKAHDHDHGHAHDKGHGHDKGHDHGHAHSSGHAPAEHDCKHDHADAHAHEHHGHDAHAAHDAGECKHDHSHELAEIKQVVDHHHGHDHAHK